MTLKLKTLAVTAIAVGGLLVATGCSSLKVNVIRHHAIPIPPGSTWAWGPPAVEKRPDELDPRVNNSIIHDRVQRAVDTVLAHPGAVVVTRDGDRFGEQGWRVGVPSAGATGAALEEATALAHGAAADLARHEERLRAAGRDVSSWRQREIELTRRLDANDGRLTAAQNGLNRARAERREAGTEAEALERTRAELTERLRREHARIAELDARLPDLEARESAQAEAGRQRREARARLDAAIASVTGKRRDLSVRAAGLDERKSFLTRRLAEVEARLTADALAHAHAAESREQLERTLVALDRLGEVLDARRAVIDGQLTDLQERRRRQSEEARAVAQALDEHRKARAAHERELEGRRERERLAELDEAEVRLRLEQAVESLRRDHDIDPDAALAAAVPTLPEGTGAPARVRDLERELRIMGPINPLALEEFTALQERHGFLETQLDDVRTTRRELAQVIKAIDSEVQSVFAGAFADVSENFTKLFGTLFPGGLGRLHLTNPDDLLNTGVEVEAKPSGKNVKKLSLLSGGERSLTALAFLFAVFRSRPSPFYVMDEVEAALDDVNLHRFLNLVDEFRREAQLLIVSHQKRTMEAADCLFGITMQPGGSSRVVSERVRSHLEA
jgi:chromosome segregation protein